MKLHLSFPVLLATGLMAFFSLSCGSGSSTSSKPRSTGTTSEILIVTDSKEVWNGPVGDTLRKYFSQPIPALPQPEQMFDMLNIAKKDFNDLFRKYHNILVVEIGNGHTRSASETIEDAWSTPQRVITMKVPDEAAFFAEFEKNRDNFIHMFNQLERIRIEILNRMSGDISLEKKVTARFNLYLSLPGGFYLAGEGPDFMWLRHKVVKGRQDIEMGIMIYTTEYKDTAQFHPNYILNWRNLQTRQYIPGPSEGSYMAVSSDFVAPIFSSPADFPMEHVVQTRGLWNVVNDFMGGPFINYTFLDQKNNRLVTLDGYIYNPNEFKRNYLRQIESIFYTVKITN